MNQWRGPSPSAALPNAQPGILRLSEQTTSHSIRSTHRACSKCRSLGLGLDLLSPNRWGWDLDDLQRKPLANNTIWLLKCVEIRMNFPIPKTLTVTTQKLAWGSQHTALISPNLLFAGSQPPQLEGTRALSILVKYSPQMILTCLLVKTPLT